ncbi:MAG: hypothetical protein M1814_003852 [Vezdaea aestivalis]|nr:MAG: hypothetical protein M1814_003852 [Vezdaea aestivalis]
MTISDAPLCDTELRLQDLDQEKAYLESPSRSPCWKHYNAKVALSAMRSFQNQTEAAAAQETQHVITHWMETAASNDTGRIENIHKACNRLSLHVLSEVLYGVELRWPHDSQYVPPQGEKSISECGTDYILEGCHFSYRESLDMAEANAPVIDALPACLLKLSPLPALRAAYQARRDRHSYMRSLVVSKRQDQASGITTKPYSLIDLLLSPLSPAYLPTLIPKPDPAIALATSLFPLANPSETALLLSTAILHLALHPSTQSLLQSHLSHPHKPRTHDSPTPPLLTAILHETSLHLCSTPSNPTLWDPLRWLSPKPPLPMPTIKLPPLATTLGTTVLATLFSSHSIELHHFAAEAALPDLRPLERRRVWEGVRGWALEMIRRGEGARVGVRLVRRGEERCRF